MQTQWEKPGLLLGFVFLSEGHCIGVSEDILINLPLFKNTLIVHVLCAALCCILAVIAVQCAGFEQNTSERMDYEFISHGLKLFVREDLAFCEFADIIEYDRLIIPVRGLVVCKLICYAGFSKPLS